MVVIPMTSMNNSGQGLKTFLLENELKDYELFVVHDDIDLGFGRFRIKKSSSDGGHNGCLLYTSPSPRDVGISRMPSSA